MEVRGPLHAVTSEQPGGEGPEVVELVVDVDAYPVVQPEVADHQLLPWRLVGIGRSPVAKGDGDGCGKTFTAGDVDGHRQDRRGVPSPEKPVQQGPGCASQGRMASSRAPRALTSGPTSSHAEGISPKGLPDASSRGVALTATLVEGAEEYLGLAPRRR